MRLLYCEVRRARGVQRGRRQGLPLILDIRVAEMSGSYGGQQV